VKANGSAIGAAEARVKQEIMRPWLPTISVGFSGGGFGGGSNRQDLNVSSFYQATGSRTDFDVFAFWQLQNMGAGNRSLQQERVAERDEAIQHRALTLNVIRREVSEAHANLQSARQRLHVAQVELSAAERAAIHDLQRTRAGEGLPIEVLNSLDLLARARLDLVDAAIAFNIAQFSLFVSLGESPLDGQRPF
jgi:outer membrane protein TolC